MIWDLSKSLDKTKLVQVEVTVQGKNGTYTRKQWKRPQDVSSTDKVIGQNNQSTTKSPKSQLVELLSKLGRDGVMELAKKNGVSWKENTHEGINWMRCSQAIQKHIEQNPDAWKNPQKPDNNSQPKQSEKPKQNASNQVSVSQDAKSKLQELVKNHGKDSILNSLKSLGVKWDENSHEGINWMRAMQAAGKAITQNSDLLDKLSDSSDRQDTKTQLADTQKKVQGLQDLVSQIQNPTAQQVTQQSKDIEVLKGITTGTMSDYEKSHFGDVVSTASPKSLRNYRTLGMCAGDKDSEQYLANLYQKYSDAIQGNVSTPKYDPNIDADPLRNKLQGVVNKQVVGVVKSSLKNVRKRLTQFIAQQKLLEPWVDPNATLTDEQKEYIKTKTPSSYSSDPYYPGDKRKACQREKDCSHGLMHRVLDKFKQSTEYGQLAEDYDKLLTEFDQLTQNNSVFQNAVNSVGNGGTIQSADEYKKSVESTISNEIDRQQGQIARLQQRMSDLKPHTQDPHYKSLYDEAQKSKEKAEQKIKELNDTKSKIDGDALVKAAKVRKQLFDPKFTDLNANLYHYKMMADQLSFQYEIKKDFVSEYPILSKANLDKLDSADEDSLTNLSLYAGMFKPSLTKGGKDAKDALMDKYSERQAFLDAYGGVTQVQGAPEYSENNEIRCKVSKANAKKSQEIIDSITKDWDRKSHGGMRYKIKGVYEVSGLASEAKFDKIKSQNKKYSSQKVGGKNCGSDLFYHGTGSMATSLILGHSGEFKIVKAKVGRMLGDGIYLADKSSKSAQYIGDAGYSRKGIQGSLMVVEASIGNTLSARTSGGKNYDSVFAGKQHGLLNNEWCVHDPNAVIPRYLVDMEIL